MYNYFCGWYFKCQSGAQSSGTQTLAVIPALHQSGFRKTCSVQIITEEGSYHIGFPYESYYECKKKFLIKIGENSFHKKGFHLNLHTPDLSVSGSVRFGQLSPIRYDIMGPFCYVPFMECRHSVKSMKHAVNGKLCVNGKEYLFRNAVGYIEGDRGYSFPKHYVWTQCFFEKGSLMLSAADIPFGLLHFTGIICVIHWCGREYRLATYLGARVIKIHNGQVIIRQGNMVLSVRLIEKNDRPLLAPAGGTMNRTIRESASCRAAYCLKRKGKTVFSFITSKASFEYEYPY